MAASDSAFATGTSQNADLRRRNVPGGAEKQAGGVQVPRIEIDGKKAIQKV
jgi:dolichyl-phosphate-mannose-protein mannosyltransferase